MIIGFKEFRIFSHSNSVSSSLKLYEDATELFRRKVISLSSLFIAALILIGLPIRHIIAPFPWFVLLVLCLVGATLFFIPLMIRKSVSTTKCLFLFIVILTFFASFTGFHNGGIHAPISILFSITPIVGFFLGG